MKHHHYAVTIFSLLMLGYLGYYAFTRGPVSPILAGAEDNTAGWAWSSNVGWISFNCTNDNSCDQIDYGVHIDPGTGLFSGFAWSSNIGWVSFNASDLAGCPEAPCEARVEDMGSDTYPKQVFGWARVLSLENFPGGGWMSVRGDTYGVQLELSGDLTGWSWEPDVVGWTSWSGDTYGVFTTAHLETSPPPPGGEGNGGGGSGGPSEIPSTPGAPREVRP